MKSEMQQYVDTRVAPRKRRVSRNVKPLIIIVVVVVVVAPRKRRVSRN